LTPKIGREVKKPGHLTWFLCLNAAIDFSIDETYAHLSPENTHGWRESARMRPIVRTALGAGGFECRGDGEFAASPHRIPVWYFETLLR
jgi:hypothetical protein